jgi:hypothetical protein
MFAGREARGVSVLTMLIAIGLSAWGIVEQNPYMIVAAAFAAVNGLAVLLAEILSVLVDIRDQTRGKKDE